MNRFFISLLSSLFILFALAACEAVNSYHPDIVNGGRINALGAHPRDDNTIIAAAETGGLFKTTDAGNSWTHLNGLPEFAMNDVKYSPGEPGVIIATCFVDTRKVNGGGIWRSTDAGNSWAIPPSSVPPASPRYTDRSSAYSISFEPGSSRVIVGTDGGIAISNDLGATWRHVLPDPGSWINGDKTQDRIYSVLCRGGGQMNIAGTNGIYYSTDAGLTWKRSVTGPAGLGWGFHRFAVSPFNSKHVFLTTDNRVYRDNPADSKKPFKSFATFLSTDGGINWSNINVPEEGFGRPSFIKTSLSLTNNAREFELWYGTGFNTYRKTCTHADSGPDLSGKWILLGVNHSDPSDLAFTTDNRYPCILSGDGGIMKTEDLGKSWKMAGGGNKGLNALQITEITGHQVAFHTYRDKEPDFHMDMYFGTQDNGVRGSPDGGKTWPYATGGEGFYIQPEGRKILSGEEARVAYVTCTDCDNRIGGAYFAGEKSWLNPNNKLEGNPFYLFTPGHYLQNSLKVLSPTETINNYQTTYSYGLNWTPRVDVPFSIAGIPHIVPGASGPVVYQAVARPGLTPSGNSRIGLIKIKNIETGTPVIYSADGSGFGSLGVFATMFAWYVVYAVNPSNPNHVIIADVTNKQMKFTLDGGRCWYPDDALTKLVTDNGNFRFEDGPFLMQVHAITFDPDDPRRIAVGTQQAGIICSLNGGVTWEKIDKTDKITNISSFFFGLDNTLYVSSYGRGLWKINLEKGNSRKLRAPLPLCPFIFYKDRVSDRVDAKVLQFEDLSDIPDCYRCRLITVKEGRITDVVLDPKGKPTGIAISGGQLQTYDSLLHEIPENEIPYTVKQENGNFSRDTAALRLLERKETIRGIVLDRGRVKGYVFSADPFPPYAKYLMQQPGNEPVISARGERQFAGLTGIEPGDSLFINGKHFNYDKNAEVILIAGKDTLAHIYPDSQGNFSLGIPVRELRPGFYTLRAIQQGPNRTAVVAQANFSVLLSEMDNRREE